MYPSLGEPIHHKNVNNGINYFENNSKKITYNGREEGKEESYQLLQEINHKKIELDSVIPTIATFEDELW